MRVPLSWLREFAPFEGDPAALGETFDDLGMVVESIERVGEGLAGVVVARVLEVHRIEGADKIRRVLVDDGTGAPVQVVCGAWNFEAGATVPFARVGAVLPGDFVIGQRKMKGVESRGMICSARELELGEDGAGILLLDEAAGEPGTPLSDALGIESDVVFDLAIETNRPDANCVAGVARDAAARLGLPFTLPGGSLPSGAETRAASIRVDAIDLCPRFTGTVLTNVTVGPSPEWIQRRLTLAGMRPINNVVDASNYVMLELGQPTHPYDLSLLPGAGLIVRAARPGETLVTLDGVERTLGEGGEDCLICDGLNQPVGIAGVMGGESSEIRDTTTTVLLEAAYFAPMAIARTSKRLGLRSEASARFERGCDPEGIDRAVARFIELLALSTEVEVDGGALDERFISPEREAIRVRTDRVNKVLGTSITSEQIAGYLDPIGFGVTVADGVLSVVPPSFRPDVTMEENVIEEVARHHGYMNIVRTIPYRPYVGSLTTYQKARRRLREVLVGAGVSEAIGRPLLAPGDLTRSGLPEGPGDVLVAPDPLALEESVLRTSLLPTLLKAVAFNQSHRVGDVALFEIGHVYRVPADDAQPLPDEREVLGAVVADAVVAKRVLDLIAQEFDLGVGLRAVDNAHGLHPSRTALVAMGGAAVGHVGEVDPAVLEAWDIEGRVGWIELDLGLVLPSEPRYRAARPVSRFPSSDIDLAFAVPDSVPADRVEQALREAAGELLESMALFDVFRDPARLGPDQRSLAYRLRFQAQDRTLTDAEVSDIRARIIAAASTSLGASIRT